MFTSCRCDIESEEIYMDLHQTQNVFVFVFVKHIYLTMNIKMFYESVAILLFCHESHIFDRSRGMIGVTNHFGNSAYALE